MCQFVMLDVCICEFCNLRLWIFVDFVMGCCVSVGILNVWICVCVGFVMFDVCMPGFCNVLVCVCVDFVMCGCVYVWIL